METKRHLDSRPAGWHNKYGQWPRAAFIAHALLPDYLSTALINERLTELGKDWMTTEAGGFVRWFSFPVVPRNHGLLPVWVDFYIIPILAPGFMAALKSGAAYKWVRHVALVAINEAKAHNVPLTIGWGALTKLATEHGQRFRHQMWGSLPQNISTTHGDAGTAAIVIETLVRASLVNGARVAVIGANGAIGDVVSRVVTSLQPASIMLVGRPDKQGETKKRDRLDGLRRRVQELVSDGEQISVTIHQDKDIACHEHKSDVVVVATTGMNLSPESVPKGALVLDMTTPAACAPNPGWEERLVLTAGCGQFDGDVIPEGFGTLAGRRLMDVGAGGLGVIWGCTGETIARASAGWRGHLTGDIIPEEELQWSTDAFLKLGFRPQPPVSFDKPLPSWSAVRQFVCRSVTSFSFPQQTPGS